MLYNVRGAIRNCHVAKKQPIQLARNAGEIAGRRSRPKYARGCSIYTIAPHRVKDAIAVAKFYSLRSRFFVETQISGGTLCKMMDCVDNSHDTEYKTQHAKDQSSSCVNTVEYCSSNLLARFHIRTFMGVRMRIVYLTHANPTSVAEQSRNNCGRDARQSRDLVSASGSSRSRITIVIAARSRHSRGHAVSSRNSRGIHEEIPRRTCIHRVSAGNFSQYSSARSIKSHIHIVDRWARARRLRLHRIKNARIEFFHARRD